MSGTSVSVLRLRCAAALLVLALLAAPAVGGDLTQRLLDDARDGRLDDFDFVTAALIAGGISNECELETWLDRYLDSLLQRDNATDLIVRANRLVLRLGL